MVAVHGADPVAESGDPDAHRARAGGPRGGGELGAEALDLCHHAKPE